MLLCRDTGLLRKGEHTGMLVDFTMETVVYILFFKSCGTTPSLFRLYMYEVSIP